MDKKLKIQSIESGYGATFQRRYSVTIPRPLEEVKKALFWIKKDPNTCSPALIAVFEKTEGERHQMAAGDEFQIHITGPWNGPIRVSEVADLRFSFKTLEGHLEAGDIHFSLKAESHTSTLFTIESKARSRDWMVDLFYDKVPIGRFMQTRMWKSFCQTFAAIASGVKDLPVTVETQRSDELSVPWSKA